MILKRAVSTHFLSFIFHITLRVPIHNVVVFSFLSFFSRSLSLFLSTWNFPPPIMSFAEELGVSEDVHLKKKGLAIPR